MFINQIDARVDPLLEDFFLLDLPSFLIASHRHDEGDLSSQNELCYLTYHTSRSDLNDVLSIQGEWMSLSIFQQLAGIFPSSSLACVLGDHVNAMSVCDVFDRYQAYL